MQANQLVKINGNAIEQIIYKSQPVITLRMMDELHERFEGAARQAFNRHKEHLKEKKHFFDVPYDEWSKCLNVSNRHDQKGGRKSSMTFLTLKGYLLLVELVLHAQKVGRHFQGVDVILYDEPVIQFSTSALKNAFDALAKENCLMQPYKSSSSLAAAMVTEDQTSIIFKTHALNKAFNTLSREHGIKNPFKNVFSLHANIRHSNQSLQWDYLNLNTRDNKGNRLYKLVKCLH